MPKIWDILKKGVEEKVGSASFLKQSIFQAAYSSRALALSQGRDTPLFNLLVFKKIKATLGGNCAYGASGGGPLAADVQMFARVCLGIKVMQVLYLIRIHTKNKIQLNVKTWNCNVVCRVMV